MCAHTQFSSHLSLLHDTTLLLPLCSCPPRLPYGLGHLTYPLCVLVGLQAAASGAGGQPAAPIVLITPGPDAYIERPGVEVGVGPKPFYVQWYVNLWQSQQQQLQLMCLSGRAVAPAAVAADGGCLSPDPMSPSSHQDRPAQQHQGCRPPQLHLAWWGVPQAASLMQAGSISISLVSARGSLMSWAVTHSLNR